MMCNPYKMLNFALKSKALKRHEHKLFKKNVYLRETGKTYPPNWDVRVRKFRKRKT